MATSPAPFVLNVSAILAANGCEGESVTRYVFELGNGAVLTGTLPAAAASQGQAGPALTKTEAEVLAALRAADAPMSIAGIYGLMRWEIDPDGQCRGFGAGVVRKMAKDGTIYKRGRLYADSSAKFEDPEDE